MRYIIFFITIFTVSSCWTKVSPSPKPVQVSQKVWGNKPVYGVDALTKKIVYLNIAQPVVTAGNIYVKGNYIFQVETGRGFHVIDNSNPATAKRIGFITMNGSSQISIKDNFLYTNSFDDLVVVDMTDITKPIEVKRIKGAFPEGRYTYYFAEPAESGYYECPRYDSLVIGWRKDSIWSACYKN